MNFSAISRNNLVGRLLRFPLRLLPYGLVLPILQGKLRGYKWIVGSGNHGCWLGSYEQDKQIVFVDLVKVGDVVFDIGAHAGYYTLLASNLVGHKGVVFSFEPLPINLQNIQEHLKINKVLNAKVINCAVSDKNGYAKFSENLDTTMNHVSTNGTLKVTTVSMDDFCNENCVFPNLIKIDIEGGEEAALLGATNLLGNHHPIIILATHSREIHKKCCEILQSFNYTLEPIGNTQLSETDEVLAYFKTRK